MSDWRDRQFTENRMVVGDYDPPKYHTCWYCGAREGTEQDEEGFWTCEVCMEEMGAELEEEEE